MTIIRTPSDQVLDGLVRAAKKPDPGRARVPGDATATVEEKIGEAPNLEGRLRCVGSWKYLSFFLICQRLRDGVVFEAPN